MEVRDAVPKDEWLTILQMTAEDYTQRQIATKLKISTVKVHNTIAFMVDMYDCRGRVSLILHAYKMGWITG